MAWTLINSDAVGFADGNTGHVYTLPSGAPAAGDLDILTANSDTVVSTPSGFTLAVTFVNSQGSYVWFRIATGGEASTVTITTSGNFNTALTWSRWQGASAFDFATQAHVEDGGGTATPAVSTGTLAGTGELVVMLAAMHGGSAPSAPSWSSGYTGLNAVTQGSSTHMAAAFTAYKTTAGTASESPSVSWSGSVADRYALVAAFKAAGGTTPIAVSDAGTGTQSLATTAAVPVMDSGASTQSVAVAAAAPLAEAGTGADALAVSRSIALAEAGSGTDSLTVTTSGPLTDSGAATDTLGSTAVLSLSEAGSAADVLIGTSNGSAIGVVDSGAGTDALAAGATTPLTDSATSTQTLTANVTGAAGTDSGAGSDTVKVTANSGLAEAGTGSDTLHVVVTAALADAAAALEALRPGAVLILADAGLAADSLVGSNPDAIPVRSRATAGSTTGSLATRTTTGGITTSSTSGEVRPL